MLHHFLQAALSAFSVVLHCALAWMLHAVTRICFPGLLLVVHMYEEFTRKLTRTLTPAAVVVPLDGRNGGRLILNAAASRLLELERVDAVRILWSKHTNALALKPAPRGEPNVYALSKHRRTGLAGVSARTFLRMIEWNAKDRVSVPARWNVSDKILEMELPAEFLGADPGTAATGLRGRNAKGAA